MRFPCWHKCNFSINKLSTIRTYHLQWWYFIIFYTYRSCSSIIRFSTVVFNLVIIVIVVTIWMGCICSSLSSFYWFIHLRTLWHLSSRMRLISQDILLLWEYHIYVILLEYYIIIISIRLIRILFVFLLFIIIVIITDFSIIVIREPCTLIGIFPSLAIHVITIHKGCTTSISIHLSKILHIH